MLFHWNEIQFNPSQEARKDGNEGRIIFKLIREKHPFNV